jgi:DNA repair protein RecO (recombination protein O)
MEWADEGVVLSARIYGESSAVVEVFTLNHGRYLGLVRGARSKRMAPTIQIANLLQVTWRARLPEQLGMFQAELLEPYAARALDDPLALAGAAAVCGLSRLLPERAPHPGLCRALKVLLAALDSPTIWPALLAPWELMLLSELGFGLELDACAATGAREDLIYVSPKSGRAVSACAGEPYKDKLLRLPPHLRAHSAPGLVALPTPLTPRDLIDGLTLTGFFIEQRLLSPAGAQLPEARQRLLGYLSRMEP